jgi:hypothetical protein
VIFVCSAEHKVRIYKEYHKAGSLKMNTALEYSTRVVQEGARRFKKSTLNHLVHLTPLRIPLMNPPTVYISLRDDGTLPTPLSPASVSLPPEPG